jgi:hypothetical protein
MNNAAVIPTGFGSDGWNATVYETVSSASHTFAVASAFNSGLQRLALAWDLRKLSNKVSDFLDDIYAQCVKAEAKAGSAGTPPTREQLEDAAKSMEQLYYVVDRLYSTARKKGLMNNSMMAASLHNIHRRSEEFLDLADWIHTAIEHSSSELENLYASSREELANGEVVDLAQVK